MKISDITIKQNPIDGKRSLNIISKKGFTITIPLEENPDRNKIEITTGEGQLSIKNLNGTLILAQDPSNYVEGVTLSNCNITIVGNDLKEDFIISDGKNTIKYITNQDGDHVIEPDTDENGYCASKDSILTKGTHTLNFEG